MNETCRATTRSWASATRHDLSDREGGGDPGTEDVARVRDDRCYTGVERPAWAVSQRRVSDANPVHVFHYQEGRAFRRSSSVEQPRDVRMLQTREHLTLAAEALDKVRIWRKQKFDGD